jgi:hypothetical protein
LTVFPEQPNLTFPLKLYSDKKVMFFSMWGEATYQFWREDGMAFDVATAGTNYEVMGGIDV